MEKKKLKRKDVVYDDDTSDSSSDEEQLERFKQQLSKRAKKKDNDSSDDDDADDVGEEDDDDGSFDSESSDDDEDDDDDDKIESKSEKKISDPKIDAKVLKLKAQLDSIKNISDEENSESASSGEDSEDDADQENEDCEDEEGAEELEDEEESDDDVGEDEDDEEENIWIEETKKTGKRKCESDEIPTKKLKVDLNEEEERLVFRAQLSSMSIEEIQELKEKVGLRAYNKSIGLKDPSLKKSSRSDFKRDNKNRPREMSSKVKVGRLRDVVGFKSGEAKKPLDKRDPRFDALCGDFDEKVFKQSYEFVEEVKAKEREQLKKELANEQDEERIKQIKYLIQRMDNQEREKKKHAKLKSSRDAERETNKELMKDGKKPVFVSKAERKAKELVEKYEELTQTGKLDHYIKRKQKKNLGKERKKMHM